MTTSSKRSCCSHTQLAGSWWRGDHQDQIPVDHPKRFLLRSSRICALLFPCIPYLSSHGRQLKKGGLQKFGSCQRPSVTHALAEDTRGSSGLAQRGGSVASWWHSGLSARQDFIWQPCARVSSTQDCQRSSTLGKKKKKSKQILQRGGEHFELTLGDTQRTANRGEPACREKRQQRQACRGSVPKIRASTRGCTQRVGHGSCSLLCSDRRKRGCHGLYFRAYMLEGCKR